MSIVIDKILAASPNTERGRPTQLSTDPKGERIAYAVSGDNVYLQGILTRYICSSLANPSFSEALMIPLTANNTSHTQLKRLSLVSLPRDSMSPLEMYLVQLRFGMP